MKSLTRLGWLVWLGLFLASGAFAQNVSGAITSSQCVSIAVSNDTATVGIQVAGTWTGTLQPEISVQGQAPANTQVTPSTSSTAQSTITANGVYKAAVAGGSTFLVCGNTVSSGTANVYLNASNGVSAGAGDGGSGSGTVSPNNGVTNAVATYAAAGGSTTVAPAANTACIPGATSGSVCLNAPAVAGTVTNPLGITNVLQLPAGNATNPSVAGSTNTNTGVNLPSTSSAVDVVAGGINAIRVVSASDRLNSVVPLNWASGDPTTTSSDTGLSRSSAGVVAVGSGANGNSTGKMLAAAFQAGGTTFTSSGGCTEATLVGGATIGKFTTSGSTSCTTVITMGSSQTATNGWVCHAVDLTTAADAANPHQTATTTTTATIATGTIVAGDVIQFSCIGY